MADKKINHEPRTCYNLGMLTENGRVFNTKKINRKKPWLKNRKKNDRPKKTRGTLVSFVREPAARSKVRSPKRRKDNVDKKLVLKREKKEKTEA